jgi:hypothetical protein
MFNYQINTIRQVNKMLTIKINSNQLKLNLKIKKLLKIKIIIIYDFQNQISKIFNINLKNIVLLE